MTTVPTAATVPAHQATSSTPVAQAISKNKVTKNLSLRVCFQALADLPIL